MRIITKEEAVETINGKQLIIQEKIETEFGTPELDLIMAECMVWHRILNFIETGYMVMMDKDERILISKEPVTIQ